MFPGRRGAGRIFHNQVQALGRRAAGVRAVRPERRRRRLHPGVLRHRDHARGQRLDVPRLAADGRDGDRREGDASRRWAARACTRASRAAGTSWSRATRRASTSARRYLSYLPGELAQQPPAAPRRSRRRRPPTDARSRELIPADENKPFDMTALIDGARRRGLAARDPPALGQGAGRRLRAPGRPGDRDRRQPAQAQGRACCSRDSADKAARFIWTLQRLQRPAAVPRRRARLHDRHAGRARGDHPPRREDDQRRQRGDRAEDLGDRAQGLRRGPVRDGRARRSSPDCCIALPSASIAVMGPQAAINAVYYNQLQAIDDEDERAAETERAARASTPRTSTSCTSPPSW